MCADHQHLSLLAVFAMSCCRAAQSSPRWSSRLLVESPKSWQAAVCAPATLLSSLLQLACVRCTAQPKGAFWVLLVLPQIQPPAEFCCITHAACVSIVLTNLTVLFWVLRSMLSCQPNRPFESSMQFRRPGMSLCAPTPPSDFTWSVTDESEVKQLVNTARGTNSQAPS